MFNLGAPEIMVILVVALIVLGPKRLPQAGRQVGRALAEFRRVSGDMKREFREAIDEDDLNELRDLRDSFDVRRIFDEPDKPRSPGGPFAAVAVAGAGGVLGAETVHGYVPNVPAPDGHPSSGEPTGLGATVDSPYPGRAIPPPSDSSLPDERTTPQGC